MKQKTQQEMNYLKSIARTPQPILPSQLPKIKMDLAGLSHYAAEKGVSLYELSKEEIAVFVPENLLKNKSLIESKTINASKLT